MATRFSFTTHVYRQLGMDEFTNRCGQRFKPTRFEVYLDEDAEGRQTISVTLHGIAILKNGSIGKANRYQHWYAVSGRVPQASRDRVGDTTLALPPELCELVEEARRLGMPHDDLLNDATTLWGER